MNVMFVLLAVALTLVPWTTAAREMTSPAPAQIPFEHDGLFDCLEPVPVAVSARGITDTGHRVRLDVLVLLDGLTRARGIAVMSKAAEAYAPLGVTMKSRFKRVKVPSDGKEMTPGSTQPVPTAEVTKLFDYARSELDGIRPRSIDVVYLLTNKDIYTMDNGDRAYGVAGVAYCIGGVRFDDAAFAIGEGASTWENIVNDDTFSAKVAAHEIGHVMGAHHHYGNCVEGDRSTEGGGDPSLCTIMWPTTVTYAAMNFGTLEAAVIRGHAVQFAAP